MKTTRYIKILVLISIVIAALSPQTAWCWGSKGHTLITEHAISILPPELKPFYEANSRYIVAFCMLPDDWRTTYKDSGPDHYLDMDKLDQPPFTNIIADRAAVEAKFGKDQVRAAGLVPWVITERYGKLVEAFKKQDTVEIALQSAFLSHFIGDTHVPFHACKDYDGKTPEQKGIHYRWEEALVNMYLDTDSLHVTSPEKVDDILKSSFSWLTKSYSLVDTILAADDKARGKDPGHAFVYYKILSEDTKDIAVQQLSTASEAVAGVYVAAWEQAGKPALPGKCAPFYWTH